MSKRILLLGGSGYIGSNLTDLLLRKNHQVFILSRGNFRIKNGAQHLKANRENVYELSYLFQELGYVFDTIIDFLCFNQFHIEKFINLFSSYTSQYIFISSEFVYDHIKCKIPIDLGEENFLLNGYGGLKRSAELALINNESNINWTIIRPTHIYGPPSHLGCFPEHHRDHELITKILNKHPLRLVENAKYYQQPIYIDDLSNLISSCISNGKTNKKIINAAGKDLICSGQYYKILAQYLNVGLNVQNVAQEEFLKACPYTKNYFVDRLYDLKHLFELDICFPRTSIDQGIKNSLDYFSNQWSNR